MSSHYLYPSIVYLQNVDFEKLDILPGTAKFAVADFAILNAGSIFDLSITVDRFGQNLIKSSSGLVFSESGIETKFAEDVSGTSSITGILDNGLTLSNKIMNSNIKTPSVDFNSVFKGILFAKMVYSVFNMSDESIESYDFTDPSKRNLSIFFDDDQTLNVANNIKYQTVGLDSSGNGQSTDDSGNIVYFDSAFNQTITEWNVGVSGEVILNSEVEYWNARTGQDLSGNETGVIPFNPNDKLMVMYSISTTFKQPNNDTVGNYSVNVANLPAFVTTSTNSVVEDTMVLRSGIGDSSFDTRFILEYNVNPTTNYLTGHQFSDHADYTSYHDNRPAGSLQGAVDEWIADPVAATETYGHISTWDTSEVTDFSFLFYQKYNFNEDLSHWDVSSAENMKSMFTQATAFNQDIGDWDVSSVTTMYHMFGDVSEFDQPIGDWRVDKVTDMSYMFNNCSNFDHPLNDWQTDSCTNMQAMFWGAAAFNQPLNPPPNGGWEVDNVTNMQSMFNGASSFNQDIGAWDTSGVTVMAYMFYSASAFDQNISNWDTSGLANNGSLNMYSNCPIDPVNKAPYT